MSGEARTRDGRLDVFIVAGEASGDVLGAGLMRALVERAGGAIAFRGVGGPLMRVAGLDSMFAMNELEAIGIAPIIRKLPLILRRLRDVVRAIVQSPPDVLVLIDAPEFTHRVARRVRQQNPSIPIVKYVSPTVWAWRPGRARAMRPYVDRVLALLPFEPEVHRRLGGPPCIYVGHPLLARLGELRPSRQEAERREADPPLVLALPGSRHQELRALGATFGDVLAAVASRHGAMEIVLPTVPHLAGEVEKVVAGWPVTATVVADEAAKLAAFRRARAAIAASGTVTLELALSGVPHVVAYRLPYLESLLARMLLHVDSVGLPNLILGDVVVPEFLQERCSTANLAPALGELLSATPTRQRQIAGFQRLEQIMGAGAVSPSLRAADAVLEMIAAQ